MKLTDNLKYPDFTIPGSLLLVMGGVSLIGFGVIGEFDVVFWILGGVPFITGILLLARLVIGTVMFAGVLIYGIYWRVFIAGFDGNVFQTVLRIIVMVGFIGMCIGQMKYFAVRRKHLEKNVQEG